MRRSTIGRLMIEDELPDDLRRDLPQLDKKSVGDFLRRVAEKHPDKYKAILKRLSDVGRKAAYSEGVSVSLSGLLKTQEEQQLLDDARAKLDAVYQSDLPPEDKKAQVLELMKPLIPELQARVQRNAEAENNPYWFQIKSGSRGKITDLNAIRGATGLVADHRNEPVPVPILHSYAEGLDPVEYWAGTYGQRRGMIDVKFSQVLGTQVLMSDLSSKRLGDIKAGDVVMGSDISGNLRPTRVMAFHDHGVQETWRYTFRRNLTKETLVLEATPDHRMLSRVASSHAYRTDKTPKKRALKEAKIYADPRKNEYVCVPAAGGDIGSIDEPRALFYGVIAGDGSCGPNAHSTEVSQADPSFIAEFGAYMAKHGCVLKKNGSQPGHRVVHTSEAQSEVDRLRTLYDSSARALARLWLEDAGMWGKLAHEKALPPEAGKWNNASMAAFVAGYASSDGCVDTRGKNSGVSFSICSTSQQLLEQVRDHLLFRWGIHASLSPVKLRSTMKCPQTKLTVSMRQSVELFAAAIPLIGQKRDQLNQALERSPQGRLFPAGYKVISAEPIGPQHVADLEVEHPDHLFVLANGLITSNSVGDAGFLTKQLVNAAHRVTVGRERPDETRLPTGLPTSPDDRGNIGAVLAADAGPFKAGQTLTSEMLDQLKDQEVDRLLVHSALTERSADGSISRWAAGRRDSTDLSAIGDNIGIPAAQAIGERVSQGMLDSKHQAGAAGTDRVSRSGFEYLNRLIQAPENFPEAGPLAGVSGRVKAVRPLDQGGHEIEIDDQTYYVQDGLNPVVKEGQAVEQGDDLSDGIPHPGDLLKHVGMGEARRRYMFALQEALENSGIGVERRNLEPLVAGMLNWAQVTDSDGMKGHIVDDVVSYNSLLSDYKAREGTQRTHLKQSEGKYLEEPVLHYTPGSRVSRKMVEELNRWGVKDLDVHDQPPAYQPYMQRGMLSVYNDEDWQTRLSGFYTTAAFQEALHRGRSSTADSTSYVPAVTQSQGLGSQLGQTGRYGPAQAPSQSPFDS